MSKKLNTILCIIFTSLSLSKIHAQSIYQLLNEATAIRSIDPDDENYSDLKFLKEKIETASVVVLGEISHDDGASFAAKSRLVKFLHQELGFDVLAWEAGFVDCLKMNDALAGDSSLRAVKNYMMRGGWDESEYVQPVFEYAERVRHTSRPLLMAGFDSGRPPKGFGNANEVIQRYLVQTIINISADEKFLIDSILKATYGFIGNSYSKALSRNSQAKARLLIKKLADSTVTISVKDKYFLRSILIDIDLENARSQNSEAWNLLRDKFMADRFIWIKDVFFPKKKIIIWAASGHLIRNGHLIQRLNPPKNFFDSIVTFPQMGDYLNNYLENKVYSIAFTAYRGERGILYPKDHRFASASYTEKIEIKQPSLETEAHKTGKPYLFIDLKKSGKFLNDFVAHPYGFNSDLAPWNKIVDAFFYIDKMYPDKKLNE